MPVEQDVRFIKGSDSIPERNLIAKGVDGNAAESAFTGLDDGTTQSDETVRFPARSVVIGAEQTISDRGIATAIQNGLTSTTGYIVIAEFDETGHIRTVAPIPQAEITFSTENPPIDQPDTSESSGQVTSLSYRFAPSPSIVALNELTFTSVLANSSVTMEFRQNNFTEDPFYTIEDIVLNENAASVVDLTGVVQDINTQVYITLRSDNVFELLGATITGFPGPDGVTQFVPAFDGKAQLITLQDISGSGFRGVYETPAALIADIPTANSGDTALVLSTGTTWYWNTAVDPDAWADSGTGSTGDVTGPSSAVNNRIAVFDGVSGKTIKDGLNTIAEVLSRANHTGEQAISTVTGLQAALDAKVDDTQIGQSPSDLVQYTADTDGSSGNPVLPGADARNLVNLPASGSGAYNDIVYINERLPSLSFQSLMQFTFPFASFTLESFHAVMKRATSGAAQTVYVQVVNSANPAAIYFTGTFSVSSTESETFDLTRTATALPAVDTEIVVIGAAEISLLIDFVGFIENGKGN